jgi:hypothetical protein
MGPVAVLLADGAPMLMVGAVVSTKTVVVVGGVKVSVASVLPFLMVPPLSTSGEAEAMPSVSVSPACTV